MPQPESPAPEKVPSERSRLFCPAVPDDLNMPTVPEAPTLEDPYEKAQVLVAVIVAVSAAIALALLAAVLHNL
jgi:hypothetical protein